MSKYIQILLHDKKLIIHSEIQTDHEAMSIKYILCEGKAWLLATTRFNVTLA